MAARKKTVFDLNLLAVESIGTSYVDQILNWTLTYGRYIVIITQIIVLTVFFLRFKLDRDHADLKESITQKQALVESIGDLEKEVRSIQTKLAYIKQISSKQELIPNILHFLQNSIPTQTSITSLIISKDKITFNAVSKDLYEFSFLLNELQQDKKFSEVSLDDIKRRDDGKVEFKINASINTIAFSKTTI